MLISLYLIVVSVVSVSCLASAFSTLFVTEGAEEERKTEVTGTRTQKTEGSNVAENKVIIEAIPFMTDFFTKAEDVMNLTPLKVATVISAQHLLDTVKNIPVSGNFPENTLNMLGNIVEQFNKTTQIIKLTAEYVNISSHYILSALNQYAKENCNQDDVKDALKTINRNFLGVISKHIRVAVKEITEKTGQKEMTGSDVLVSTAYHIVAAFQDMTNQVMALKVDNKCDFPNLQKTQLNVEQVENTDTNKTDKVVDNSEHDVIHKSIKKDQALPKTEPIFTFTDRGTLQDSLTIENVDQNPDLTIEIFPSEPFIRNGKDEKTLVTQEVNIPESLKVAFLPERSRILKESKVNKQENHFESQQGQEKNMNKITKKNLKNYEDMFIIDPNPNQELTMEILPFQNLVHDKQGSPSKTNEEYKRQRLENFNVFYYPFKTFDQHKKPLPNSDTNKLKVPEDPRVHHYPQNLKTQAMDNRRENLKHKITPMETLSLFGNSRTYNNNNQQKYEYKPTKTEGTQTNIKNSDNKLTIEILNRQDLTAEVFSPEAYMHNGRDESSVENVQERLNPPKIKETKSRLETNIKNGNPKKHQEHKRFYHKNPKIRTLDQELASSAVDSLSNVPSVSVESEIKSMKDGKATKTKLNANKGLPIVSIPWGKGTQQFLGPPSRKSQQKHSLCDETVKPVCGIDKNKNNFIIFLNDCQRHHHNNMYKTSYEWTNMDTCVGFLLKYSSGSPTKYMNIIPR